MEIKKTYPFKFTVLLVNGDLKFNTLEEIETWAEEYLGAGSDLNEIESITGIDGKQYGISWKAVMEEI